MADTEMTWQTLVEEFKTGYLTAEEAREILNEISYDMDEDKVEEIENMIYEQEERLLLEGAMWADSLPQDAVDDGYGPELMDNYEDWEDS